MTDAIDHSQSLGCPNKKTLTEAERQEVQRLASDYWNLSSSKLFVEEKTHLYPWAKAHRFAWVSDRRGDILTMVISKNGVDLYRDQSCLNKLNRFFFDEEILLPHHLDAHIHACCLRDLLSAPGGILGCQKTLAREAPAIKQWKKPGSSMDINRLFKAYCEDPVIQADTHDWSFSFFNFTRSGAVEQWRIDGHSARMTAIQKNVAESDGTLRFPYV